MAHGSHVLGLASPVRVRANCLREGIGLISLSNAAAALKETQMESPVWGANRTQKPPKRACIKPGPQPIAPSPSESASLDR
jgi:hypothetical protein